MIHSSVYGSEAMNGDVLYIEIVSEEENAVKEIAAKINEANIRTRYELQQWVEKQNLKLLENEGDIDQYDEYFIEI